AGTASNRDVGAEKDIHARTVRGAAIAAAAADRLGRDGRRGAAQRADGGILQPDRHIAAVAALRARAADGEAGEVEPFLHGRSAGPTAAADGLRQHADRPGARGGNGSSAAQDLDHIAPAAAAAAAAQGGRRLRGAQGQAEHAAAIAAAAADGLGDRAVGIQARRLDRAAALHADIDGIGVPAGAALTAYCGNALGRAGVAAAAADGLSQYTDPRLAAGGYPAAQCDVDGAARAGGTALAADRDDT